MNTRRDNALLDVSLAGARIWLSGSLPEVEVSTEQERAALLAFVRQFAARVFRLGGHILHGSHPSFTLTLLQEARAYQEAGGRKDCLTLAVSRFWSKDSGTVPMDEWRNACVVYETPEAPGQNARDESLEILRNWMAARSDAVVVVGGKWWKDVAGRSGVPLEVGLALDRHIPCFLLGGLGGAAKAFLDQHPNLLSRLKNGLTESANYSLATDADASALVDRVCEQLGRLPLVRGRGSDGVSFRILALDGGGIKGTFAASALAAWEEHTKRRVVDHFDLIAGTSTGGILAIGLGIGLPAKKMLAFYRERGPRVFPVTSMGRRLRHAMRHVIHPKFSQEVLLDELRRVYYEGRKPVVLGESLCRLLVPAYRAVAGASHSFRTPHHPDLTGDANKDVAEVALATAAAPTYFSAAKVASTIADSSYFDGGVWANCPALAAVVEATCYLGIPLDRIDILSVGTTEEPFTARKLTRSGIFGWASKLVPLLMNAQQGACLEQARLLVGEPQFMRVNRHPTSEAKEPRFVRVNTKTAPGSYRLDSPKEIGELADLGEHAARDPETLGKVKSRFLNGVFVCPWEKHA